MSHSVEMPEKCGVLFEPHRYKVLHGGRGGGKSHSIAKALLVLAAQKPMRVLCARELQASIQESVYELLKQQIDKLNLSGFYTIQKSTILGANGSDFFFAGLRHNATKIKSMEGADVAWVEEAERVSEESWALLIPTIRKACSEIWVSFNPQEESDPAYRRFVKNPPPGAAVVEINWQDNPWFPETLRHEKDWLYSVDSEAADHIWGGKLRKYGTAQILRERWRIETFEPKPGWDGPYYGADWGFANDPTALVRLWIEREPQDPKKPDAPRASTLYVEHEAWGVGVDIDDTPALFDKVPGAREHTIWADSARPETISYMQKHGYPKIAGAQKGPGSVEEGIAHLRSYKAIVIHPRCQRTADEARLWSWKVDRLTGEILPEQVDKFNHCMDSARYALSPIIRGPREYDVKLF